MLATVDSVPGEIAEPSTWRVAPMTASHAAAMVRWEYAPPYQRYSLIGRDASTFTDPANGFVAIVDGLGTLVGYRSYGPDGRVPGGRYDDAALDTGGGLRPDLAGHGYGRAAIELGLAFGVATYRPQRFRVTVWSHNERALKVLRAIGFVAVDQFESSTDGDEYTILVRRSGT